jgi:aryl-alcohol dehydrogenase-like predicted oxidoreductase
MTSAEKPDESKQRLSPMSRLGFGSFKIGRNEGIKYPTAYALPTETEAAELLNGVLDLGCNLIDTAPAYGLSEERIGNAIGHRRHEYLLSTKVGETFEASPGRSHYDYSAESVRASVERSLKRLKTDVVDFVFIHSNGDDRRILTETDVVPVLRDLRAAGLVRAIGMSGKSIEGAQLAMEWADAIMVEYNLQDQSHHDMITHAAEQGIAVIVKKGLASGNLSPTESIRFVLSHPGVASLVVGGLSLDHFRANWSVAVDLAAGRG